MKCVESIPRILLETIVSEILETPENFPGTVKPFSIYRLDGRIADDDLSERT